MKRSRSNGAAIERKYPAKKNGRAWPTATLEQLRWRRDIALVDGDTRLAFALATEIDKARGFY